MVDDEDGVGDLGGVGTDDLGPLDQRVQPMQVELDVDTPFGKTTIQVRKPSDCTHVAVDFEHLTPSDPVVVG